MENKSRLYELIDRLQVCSERKYPDRKWTMEKYHSIAFEWLGMEDELEQRVLKLEKEAASQ